MKTVSGKITKERKEAVLDELESRAGFDWVIREIEENDPELIDEIAEALINAVIDN